MGTAEYAQEHGELAEYRWSMRLNQECREELDLAISRNFKDSILNKEFVKGFVERYGIDRVANIVASTITRSDWDRRYSDENRAWAETVPLAGSEETRAWLCLASHPVLVNSVADDIRKEYIKQKSETEGGEKEMPEQQAQVQAAKKPQRKWLKFKISNDAIIRMNDRWSWIRMPQDDPDFMDCTYNVFTSRMKETTIPTDAQSDERERGWEITIAEDETVLLKGRDGDEFELKARDLIYLVDGTTSEQYVVAQREKGNIVIPREAVMKSYEKTTLFVVPNGVGYDGYVYYLPNSVIKENTDTEKGDIAASIGADFHVTLRKGEEKVQLTGGQFAEMLARATADSYKRQPTAMDEYREQQGENKQQSGWKSVPLNKNAILHRYENSTLLKMPKGNYEGLVCYIPNDLIKEDENNLRMVLPVDFTARLKDDDKVIEINAAEFAEEFNNKTDEDYTTVFRKPSAEKRKAFEALEKNLRENVPDEMKEKPNWVVVQTSKNKGTGRLEKFLIDVNTGKAAKSNDPSTWTDFDTACKYAKENGGAALAYALDGQDNIVCIDVDGCLDEAGNISSVGATTAGFGNGTYCERSISGRGIHVFGKMKNLDVRAFSKDGDLEFYQDKHFIAMTGDLYSIEKGKELKDLDKTGMREYLSEKCAKRVEWQGTCLGAEGLSTMDDREVLEKAMNAKNGDTFKRLYNGEDIRNNHSNSDMSLMRQLAFWCRHDKDQMLRIFATSGLYRPDKPQSYYEYTAMKAVKSSPAYTPPKASNSSPKGSGGNNSKA